MLKTAFTLSSIDAIILINGNFGDCYVLFNDDNNGIIFNKLFDVMIIVHHVRRSLSFLLYPIPQDQLLKLFPIFLKMPYLFDAV